MATTMTAKETTHLYLVRHGQTEYNRKHIVQGRGVNASLNETGIHQARALSRRFASMPLDVIYSSPLRRASETAQIVAENQREVPMRYDAGLEEMSWGIYEGQQVSAQLKEVFDEMRMRWNQGELGYKVPEGESLLEVQQRGLMAIDRIITDNPGSQIMVVAHGRFLRIILASLLKEFGIPRMEEISHSNTGVNHLVHSENHFQARLMNCTIHLEEKQAFKN